MPVLQTKAKSISCFNRGELQLQLQGKLPLVSYWHDWQMQVSDAQTAMPLGNPTDLVFDPDTARLSFEPIELDAASYPETNEVLVDLKARFGFDPLTFAPVRMRLPTKDAGQLLRSIDGQREVISGEQAQLAIRDAAIAACVEGLLLELPDGKVIRSEPATPNRLDVDLRKTPSSDLKLTVQQSGGGAVPLTLHVLPQRAHITRVEHAQSDSGLTVSGSQLERIARIELGNVSCSADAARPHATMPQTWVMTCDGDISDNAKLPDQVQVVHRDDEPGPLRVSLIKTATKPRFVVSEQAPNAIVVSPSAKALQWGLSPTGTYMSEDSGLNLLLQAQAPYSLVRGTYVLQLRFKNDPQTDSQPMNASLIADFAHNELRTRNPVNFAQIDLPSVVNPLEYRISHNPSGLNSEWQSLPRQVLMLPELKGASCSPQGDALWVHGARLDLIDAVRVGTEAEFQDAQLVSCPQGLCLSLPISADEGALHLRLRWVDDRLFQPKNPELAQACASPPHN